jgi:hypothetical protein
VATPAADPVFVDTNILVYANTATAPAMADHLERDARHPSRRGQPIARPDIISVRGRGYPMATAFDGPHPALHLTARVQPGNKIEITAPDLKEGQEVDVFLIPRTPAMSPRRSVLEFLDTLPPGPRSAPTWDEIERRFQEERDAWDR